MDQKKNTVSIFSVYNNDEAPGEVSLDYLDQYTFDSEEKALKECAFFMKKTIINGIMLSGRETEKMFAPLTLALARGEVRAALNLYLLRFFFLMVNILRLRFLLVKQKLSFKISLVFKIFLS